MKLRAQFVVDVTAADFVQAADHQKRLGDILEGLKQQYADATLTIRERRKPKVVRPPRPESDLAPAG
jgi:hypothetical protein